MQENDIKTHKLLKYSSLQTTAKVLHFVKNEKRTSLKMSRVNCIK